MTSFDICLCHPIFFTLLPKMVVFPNVLSPKIYSQVACIEVITYCGNGFFFKKKRKIESHFDEASKRVNCLTSMQCNDDYISHVRI